eukprot:TRINITY_DN5362_c0_g1_i3.p1 TRINITY_DN5362_c0_g1~~TRINITY_DN5362_c0_g1_i3.p1  ORF type:complete len:335 (-),score=64.93 TRINITY_DN5362_c0_g1_i3:183-1121(-)
MPVSLPTSAGTRETLDLGYPVLNLQKLEDPKVSIHQCAQKYGSQAIRSIFQKLQERSSLPSFEEINLSDNFIGDEGAKFLKEGLSGNTKLKRLLLPRSQVRSAGFQAIGGLIGSLPSLEMLVLSGNIADAEDVCDEFGKGLSMNKSLKSLCLAACRLGDQGVTSLCDGPLKTHSSLSHLSLNYNRLEDAACASIVKMLAVNKTLEYLELCGNSIGPAGAESLVKGLIANKGKLRRLGLGQNSIRLRGAKALCAHFMSSQGQHLEFLDLRHNCVTYPGVVEIRQMLGKPLDDDEHNKGWMLNFGERQLMLNAF